MRGQKKSFEEAERYIPQLATAKKQRIRRVEQTADGFENTHDLEDHRAIYNETDEQVACVATTKYQLRQHQNYFQTAFEAIRNFGMDVDHVVVKDSRERVDMEIIPNTAKIFNDTFQVKLGVRYSNSIDQSISATIWPYGLEESESFNIYGRSLLGGQSMRHVGSNISEERIREVTKNSIAKAEESLNSVIQNAQSVQVDNALDLLEEAGLGKTYREDIVKQFQPGVIAHDSGTVNGNVSVWNIFCAASEIVDEKQEIKEGTRDDLHRKVNRIILRA